MAELNEEQAAYQANLENLVGTRTEQLRKVMSELEHAKGVMLDAFGDCLTLRDYPTGVHSKRVTSFTIAVARAMGLPQDQIILIAKGAYLHDIGKLAVPDTVLHKPGPLTDEETIVMQGHCLSGYEMVRQIPFLAEAAEVIHAHHERWDGKGYPQGLQGEAIPLGARIVSVVNAYDSICTDQKYRRAKTLDFAVREITDGAGTQFDPEVVKAFLILPPSKLADLAREVANSLKDPEERPAGRHPD